MDEHEHPQKTKAVMKSKFLFPILIGFIWFMIDSGNSIWSKTATGNNKHKRNASFRMPTH